MHRSLCPFRTAKWNRPAAASSEPRDRGAGVKEAVEEWTAEHTHQRGASGSGLFTHGAGVRCASRARAKNDSRRPWCAAYSGRWAAISRS